MNAKLDNTLSWSKVRDLCLECGADDVGWVSLDHPDIADQLDDIKRALPSTKSLLSLVVRMNREPIRSVQRSVANLEFHATGDELGTVSRRVVRALEDLGVRALNPSVGFPMEMDNFPGKIWVVSHKPIAQAAGLGKIGIHRNVIHPKFGSFILLATILTELEFEAPVRVLDFNPCFECKLCVAACPVGAIEPDGYFNFGACYTHNYREFMGGFTDWVESVAGASDVKDYRKKFSDAESGSMWQSLSFGANYKAAYCLAVCPAGEQVRIPFDEDRPQFLKDVVKPLQAKVETLYVVKGSDAEAHAARRFPHKRLKRVNGLRPASVPSFVEGMRLGFQRGASRGWAATYHFVFRGADRSEVTVRLDNGSLEVSPGLAGKADLVVRADADTWVGFLRKEVSLPLALFTRRIRLSGNPKWLVKFGKCFPS